MPKPTRFAQRSPELDPERTERNHAVKAAPAVVEPASDPVQAQIEAEGFSHPVSFYRATVVLPKDNPLYRWAAPRDGQINELSVFIEMSVDGPVYVRAVNPAKMKAPILDDKWFSIEKQLVVGEWVTLPTFRVEQGDRLDLVISNEPYSFDKSVTDEQRKAAIGSENLMISGVWVTFMYFAKGGNRGAGQELVGLPARGVAERR